MAQRTFIVDGGELRIVVAQYDDPPPVVNDQLGQVWVKPGPDQPYERANGTNLQPTESVPMGEATFVFPGV